MRMFPILTGLLLLAPFAHAADEQDYKQEVKRLQERVDLLEAKWLFCSPRSPQRSPPPRHWFRMSRSSPSPNGAT